MEHKHSKYQGQQIVKIAKKCVRPSIFKHFLDAVVGLTRHFWKQWHLYLKTTGMNSVRRCRRIRGSIFYGLRNVPGHPSIVIWATDRRLPVKHSTESNAMRLPSPTNNDVTQDGEHSQKRVKIRMPWANLLDLQIRTRRRRVDASIFALEILWKWEFKWFANRT